MGQPFSRIFDSLRVLIMGGQDRRILMVGLDGAGKSTILYKLKLGEVVQSGPTVGFNVEVVEYKNIRFTVWDVGGQERCRSLWRHYYKGTHAVIYVVDSSDRARIVVAREELDKMLSDEDMRDAILLVFANKQDLPNAMKVSEMAEKLGLHRLKDRKWHVQGTSAHAGDGLSEGLDWVSNTLVPGRPTAESQPSLSPSVTPIPTATRPPLSEPAAVKTNPSLAAPASSIPSLLPRRSALAATADTGDEVCAPKLSVLAPGGSVVDHFSPGLCVLAFFALSLIGFRIARKARKPRQLSRDPLLVS